MPSTLTPDLQNTYFCEFMTIMAGAQPPLFEGGEEAWGTGGEEKEEGWSAGGEEEQKRGWWESGSSTAVNFW